MPSWNIHTAVAERVIADDQGLLEGVDANAFLFGNYVPDIYVGFMVPDATLHVDYCITHVAELDLVPVPDADRFWNHYIARRAPSTPAGWGLVLGAWAHLVADRYYNGRFRSFYTARGMTLGEELRKGKQGDFDLFGRTLGISNLVEATPELLDAAWSFSPYRILPDDVHRSIDVANRIVAEGSALPASHDEYRLLSAEWMNDVLEDCIERILTWLSAWRRLQDEGQRCLSAAIRQAAGLPDAML